MIIYDMSGIFFASVHEYYSRETALIEENTLRGLILSRISYLNKKFSNKYGSNIVLAFDSRDDYWKKKIFSLYKANRKKARDKNTKIDFDLVFPMWNKIADEFMANLPYHSIRLSGVEADEIFATLCFRYADVEKNILIISTDEDSVQLQKLYSNVHQYSLKRKAMLTVENTNYDLFEHIVRGDTGDGIPNILSESNCLVEGVTQTRLYKKDLEAWRLNGGLRYPEKFCDEKMLERFKLNKKLIDFDEIPMDIIDQIDDFYKNFKKPKGKLFNYFINHGLTGLMGNFK